MGKNTLKRCCRCKHYAPDKYESNRGGCAMMGDINDVGDFARPRRAAFDTSRAYGADYESYMASVVVGVDFGCLHWEKP